MSETGTAGLSHFSSYDPLVSRAGEGGDPGPAVYRRVTYRRERARRVFLRALERNHADHAAGDAHDAPADSLSVLQRAEIVLGYLLALATIAGLALGALFT